MKLSISKNEAFYISGDARGLSVRCGQGQLWLTQPGDSRDHLLSDGQEVIISKKGKIVVVACEDSNIDCNDPKSFMNATRTKVSFMG